MQREKEARTHPSLSSSLVVSCVAAFLALVLLEDEGGVVATEAVCVFMGIVHGVL